ncbi:MAG: hypothetical protein ACRDN9_11810 [Streptosporangiaceae bacterium]
MLSLGLLLVALSAGGTALLATTALPAGVAWTVRVPWEGPVSVVPLQVFLAGLAAALVFCLGLALVSASVRRRRRIAARVRAAEDEADAAVSERDRLAGELRRERAARLQAEFPERVPGGPYAELASDDSPPLSTHRVQPETPTA